MIMTIVESGGKLPKGASAAVFAMLGYVAAASIVAGLGDLGAGLLVLVMGGVAVGIVDYVMWRDVARADAEAGNDGVTRTSLGAYVLAGPEEPRPPEAPSAIHAFDPRRTEGAAATAPSVPHAPASSHQSTSSFAAGEPAPIVSSGPGAVPLDHAPPAANDADAAGSAASRAPAPPAGVGPVPAVSEPISAGEPGPEEKADAVGSRPATLAAPRGEPDDLKRINGIGPTNEKKLNALGVWHLHQIASWNDAETRWVGAYLAFPGRIEREDWVGQARALTGSDAATA